MNKSRLPYRLPIYHILGYTSTCVILGLPPISLHSISLNLIILFHSGIFFVAILNVKQTSSQITRMPDKDITYTHRQHQTAEQYMCKSYIQYVEYRD